MNHNNNNEYLERLTRTGSKRLHILYKYILSKINAYNMNAHTHTRMHTDSHTHTHQSHISHQPTLTAHTWLMGWCKSSFFVEFYLPSCFPWKEIQTFIKITVITVFSYHCSYCYCLCVCVCVCVCVWVCVCVCVCVCRGQEGGRSVFHTLPVATDRFSDGKLQLPFTVETTIQYNFIAKCQYTDCKRNVLRGRLQP